MYNKFFGFKEKPFKLVPDPEYLFLSKSHEEALAHLTYAISQGEGFVEITGEVGTGKTTLCRVFLENLDKSIHVAYIFNPKLDALQLLKAINDELGIDSTPDNTKDLIDRLNVFLIEKKAAGEKVLVLIDEAQNLSLEVLEQLRLLSNLETSREKLLQIILVGQPELGEMLSSHQLRQLGQRITINCQLVPLTYEETRDYIRHRIALASHRAGPPFDRAAYQAIYQYSRGIPRLINIACDRALLNSFGRNSFKITNAIAREAISELSRKKAAPTHSRSHLPAFLVIGTLLAVPLAVLLLYSGNLELLQTSGTGEHAMQTEQQVKAASAPVPIPDAGEQTAGLDPGQGPEQTAASGPGADPPASPEPTAIAPVMQTPTAAVPAASEKDSQADLPAPQDFHAYLLNLNSRASRHGSAGQILKLWQPAAVINPELDKIETDRFFYQEAGRQYGLQVQPIATAADLGPIETLDLPAIFTFYLDGHSWPKYLAVIRMDPEKVYFAGAESGLTDSVDRKTFLHYWSGEAFIFWKNFIGLDGVISLRSKGRDVLELKNLLRRIGYAQLDPSDRYDNGTQQIIRTIQAKYDLYTDGLVGPFTKIALYNESGSFLKPSLGMLAAAGMEKGS